MFFKAGREIILSMQLVDSARCLIKQAEGSDAVNKSDALLSRDAFQTRY